MKLLLVFFCYVAAIAAARGQYVVDTGTPDQTSNIGLFYVDDTDAQLLAQKFTLLSAASVTRIEAYMKGLGATVRIDLSNLTGTNATPANVFTNFTVTAPFVSGGVNTGTWVGQNLNLLLPAGNYFLVFSSSNTSGATFGRKAVNNIGPSYFAGQGNGDINIAFPPASKFLQLNAAAQLGVRLTGSNVVVQPPTLAIDTYPGLSITGTVGFPHRIDYATILSPTTNWQTLTNIVLPTSPYLYVDTTGPVRSNRFYRAVVP